MTIKFKGFLSGNTIKIISAVAMLIDHIGFAFYPYFIGETLMLAMRSIGRIAMPLFAFMIAEGCRHTKDRKRYFLMIFLLGVVCDIVYYVAMQELYLCILTTFSFSILLIYSYDGMVKSVKEKNNGFLYHLICFACVASVLVLANTWATDKGGYLDYGILGALLPLLCYLFKNRWLRTLMMALGVLAMCLSDMLGGFEGFPYYWFAFVPVIIAALYNGERGKLKLKSFFYLFYPIHLVAIQGIVILLSLTL
ncbi:MAG: hypothetical protein IKC36_04395 [Clostridia bacterium]|nr:hypothetical protein [Clostridia bacterium]